jgi:hypothetical protein
VQVTIHNMWMVDRNREFHIEERLRADLIRNDLTSEWKEHGASERTQFVILTNTIHEGIFVASPDITKG